MFKIKTMTSFQIILKIFEPEEDPTKRLLRQNNLVSLGVRSLTNLSTKIW